jgi:hypothetical protein
MALNRSTAKGAARVHFNPIKIDYNTRAAIGLIQQYGSRFDWWQALVCPCTLSPQQTDLKFRQLACGLCNGTGWTYVFTNEIRAVPSSNRREEQTLTYRVAQPGVLSNIFVNLTCEPAYKVNIRDRMVFKESVTFRSEAKVFDPAIETYNFTFPIVELMQVLDVDGKSYDCTNLNVEDRDVDSNADGQLVWTEGKCRPPSGKGFSALYTFFPSYIVITAAHEIRGTVAGKSPATGGVQAFEDLPRLFTAKLEIPDSYLFG